MTQRLYYDNGRTECEAIVIKCVKTDTGYDVLTDSTVIFPLSGGQLSDVGVFNGLCVTGAREDGEDVWHTVEKPLAEGESYIMHADAQIRLDHSQQHTGEHILSGLANKLYGAVNVGFHMAKDYATLDLDLYLDAEKLSALEEAANEAVQKNIPVTYETVSGEQLEHIKLRKQAKGLTGDIRIVYIEDVDSCTCCGTHCKTTGEVGYIRIDSAIKYKSGTRVWFSCGMRAVRAAYAEKCTVDALSKRFSVKPEDVSTAVLHQGDELSSVKHTLKKRTDELLDYRACELMDNSITAGRTRLILHAFEDMGAFELKTLCEKLTKNSRTVAVIFGVGNDTTLYQLMRSADAKPSMKELCRAVNAAVGGKGGGRDENAQGSAKASAGFAETLEQLENYLKKVLAAE